MWISWKGNEELKAHQKNREHTITKTRAQNGFRLSLVVVYRGTNDFYHGGISRKQTSNGAHNNRFLYSWARRELFLFPNANVENSGRNASGIFDIGRAPRR